MATFLRIFVNMPSVFGQGYTSFHAHNNPVTIPIRKSGESPISLLDFCKAVTPTCQLSPLLFNGHLQTFWTTVSHDDAAVYYKTHVFQADNPSFSGSFAVDFAVSCYEGSVDSLPPRTTHYTRMQVDELRSDDNRPMLVILHGLSGGSHEL